MPKSTAETPLSPRARVSVPASADATRTPDGLVRTIQGESASPQDMRRSTATPRIAVIMVTWNRKEMIARVLRDLAEQTYPPGEIDVVVTDNASTDGTLEYLEEQFSPERIVQNPTTRAHKPDFRMPDKTNGPNTLGFGSLTIIRNRANHGGCGGFNTGFAFVERVLDAAGSKTRPDYVWLVDDDVRMPTDTCTKLVATATEDETIGLVGTRTVHIDKPAETIETTIYFNPVTGLMDDHPPAGHRLEASHNEWVSRVGSPKGEHTYTGVRQVDVVSACSMLARWSGVKRVGFWDWRYFIYCDDADWCMRFAKAGYRVVLNLDATVLHTPWHYKLTPARLYYAQRNVVWMMQKVLDPPVLRKVIARRLYTLLRDSLKASFMRRRFHAEIIRRTAADICAGKTGKLDFVSPPITDIGLALSDSDLLRSDREIAFLCSDRRSLRWAMQVRSVIRVRAAQKNKNPPRFLEVVRNDVPGAHDAPPAGVSRMAYAPRRLSRLVRRPWKMLLRRPDAAVVFEQVNDFPLPAGQYNIHIDPRTLDTDQIGACQIEPDGFGLRMQFFWRWVRTALRCCVYIASLKPYRSTERYGGVAEHKLDVRDLPHTPAVPTAGHAHAAANLRTQGENRRE